MLVLENLYLLYLVVNNVPNFFNENINIELPIFIIHGNHDMPSSEYGNLSVLDLLHVGNYVSSFILFDEKIIKF